jgi:hypothetical protein
MKRLLASLLLIAIVIVSTGAQAVVIHASGYAQIDQLTGNGRISGLFVDSSGRPNYSLSSFQNPSNEGLYRFTSRNTTEKWSDADGFDASASSNNTVLLTGRSISTNVTRVESDGTFGELIPSSSAIEWLYGTISPDASQAYVTAVNNLFELDPITGATNLVDTPGLSGFLDGVFVSDGSFLFSASDRLSNQTGIYRLGPYGPQLFSSNGQPAFSMAAAPDGGLWFVTAFSPQSSLYYVDSSGLASLIASDLFAGDAHVAFDPASGSLYTAAQDPAGTITVFSTPFSSLIGIPIPPTVWLLLLAVGSLGLARRRKRAA